MAERFTKLSKRLTGSGDQEVLHEGVPAHLHSTLEQFIRAACTFPGPYGLTPDDEMLRAGERVLELRLNWSSAHHALSSLVDLTLHSEDGVDILDWVVNRDGATGLVRRLDSSLQEAGSAWRVRADAQGLERRVDETVRDAAGLAMAQGKAGAHLKEAWAASYGVSPDPSKAYSQSVKAVEVAAHAVVSPNDARATLGTMIGELRANHAKFHVAIAGRGKATADGPVMGGATIVQLMAELLWTGQHDRHGTFDPSQPISVSQQEAEAAVQLAALLVHWFSSGAITRS